MEMKARDVKRSQLLAHRIWTGHGPPDTLHVCPAYGSAHESDARRRVISIRSHRLSLPPIRAK